MNTTELYNIRLDTGTTRDNHDTIVLNICIPLSKRGSSPEPIASDSHTVSKQLILWDTDSITRAQHYMFSFYWCCIFNSGFSPDAVWFKFCSVLFYCVAHFARVIYLRKAKFNTAHNKSLGRLFSLKASIWRKLRNEPPLSATATLFKNHYKAITVRIHSSILQSRRQAEANVINAADIKLFYRFVISMLRSFKHRYFPYVSKCRYCCQSLF